MFPNETLTIRLAAHLKSQLESLAARTHRSPSWLAAQAMSAYVETQSW